MKVQDLLGSPPGILLGLATARTLPRAAACWLSRRVACWMRRRQTQLFCTVRANLRHVLDSDTNPAVYDRLAEQIIYHAGCSYYDTFRLRPADLAKTEVITADPETWPRAEAALRDARGTIIVGAHIGNFDLAAQWMAAQGLEIQALSLANPNAGTRAVNALRRRAGIEVTPIGVSALRSAIARLQQGGIIITGVDRPVQGEDKTLPFFGTPARLPSGHVRLALRTDARIIVAYCILDGPDGHHTLYCQAPLEMERTGSRRDDVEHNARRVLREVEDSIRHHPEQWLMLVPVWEQPPAE